MTIKKPRIKIENTFLIGVSITMAAIPLFIIYSLWTSQLILDECGSLPLSAYTNPDDTTPAKCYAMWKDGRL